MQSGISASAELHEAFNNFVSDQSLFCLPVTITNEQLTPLPALPFSNSSTSTKDAADNDSPFFASLPSLSAVLQPKTPIYLLLRRTASQGLIALTYVPSNSPVRAKTLFASTRATVVRELGSEKFSDSVFAVEEAEVLNEREWRERDADRGITRRNGGGVGNPDIDEEEEERRRQEVMGEQERELYLLKKAEAEVRNMSHRRDIGIGGSSGGQQKTMPTGEGVKEAWAAVQNEEGKLVAMVIDVPTETINLAANQSNVSPADVPGLISNSKPQFTFYHYPDSSSLVFIYTCPSSSSIKERMLNASSRLSIMRMAESEGVKITHKIEASDGDEITKERLDEEVNPPKAQAPTRGFARPKRPGR
ncbi:hypothetical protein VTO42DRAFT_3097 [Malbranchea cinnamomea]